MGSEKNKGHREDGKKSQWDGDKIKGAPGPTEGMETRGRRKVRGAGAVSEAPRRSWKFIYLPACRQKHHSAVLSDWRPAVSRPQSFVSKIKDKAWRWRKKGERRAKIERAKSARLERGGLKLVVPLADLKTGFSLEVFSVEFKNECVTDQLSSSFLVSVFPSARLLLITVNAARMHCVKSSLPCQKSFIHLPVVSLR